MKQETVIFEGFTFTVIYSNDGNPQIYQDAKGFCGATWLSVSKVPPGKELLIETINSKFKTQFSLNREGYIIHE